MTVMVKHYRPNENLCEIRHYRDGLLHSPNPETPAYRSFNHNGSVSEEHHFVNGLVKGYEHPE